MIFVDVDSKDLSQGLSSPPAAFVDSTCLSTLQALISPQGKVSKNDKEKAVVLQRDFTLRSVYCMPQENFPYDIFCVRIFHYQNLTLNYLRAVASLRHIFQAFKEDQNQYIQNSWHLAC